jgi:hypothetical protein
VEGQCLYSESRFKYVIRECILHCFCFIFSYYIRVYTYNSLWEYVLANRKAAVSFMEYYLVSCVNDTVVKSSSR